jgi:hypothetical protein
MTDLYVEVPKDGYYFNESGIKRIAEMHGAATYMGFWCTKGKGGNWNDTPVDVFYQPNPDVAKGHTNYFGVFRRNEADALWITNAETAFSEPMTGVICEDGEVLVSRYRHDYRTKGDRMVDGGRDYTRRSLHPTATVTVVNGNFVIKEG